MIEKVAEYTQNERDDMIFTIYNGSKDLSLVKTASYASEVASYIQSLEKEKGYLYALVNALTAGEYYGSNRNGDFFPEEALKERHGTFVEHGHVYKHHCNKDPKKSMGKVIFSHYNDHMKRVELVVKLKEDHNDVQKIIRDIGEGKVISTSMGCRVPFDICSVSKKRAKTRAEYSPYLLNQMNEILPDGRKVYAINTKPTFFDISIVTIPADPVSSFMSMLGGVEKRASYDKTSEDKKAQITKKLEGDLDWVADDPKGLIRASQERMTQEEIEKISSYPLNETLSTLMALRVLPVKEDFQKIALYSIGEKEMADQLEKEGKVFEINLDTSPEEITDIGPEKANEKIANVLKENIFDYCLTKPAIINRLIKQASIKDAPVKIDPKDTERSFIKRLLFDEPQVQPASSGVKNPLIPMATLGAMYAGYSKLFGNTANASGFTNFVGRNPWVGPLIGAGIAAGLTQSQKRILKDVNNPNFEKTASAIGPYVGSFLVSAPLTYYASANAELKARKGKKLDTLEQTVRKHPLPMALLGGAAGGRLFKGMKNSFSRVGTAKAGAGKASKKNPWESKNFSKKAEYLDGLEKETINLIFKELTS